MKKICAKLWSNWYWVLFFGVIGIQAAVFLVFGENSYIAVHDNLDLFMGHFQAMKFSQTFWGSGGNVPILGSISRDYLSSEFSLYNVLFWLLPPFAAYMSGYFLKILIGSLSCILLAKDIYKENYFKYRPAAVVLGLAYGCLPLFPAYGLAFASIPLAVLLLRRIYRGESRMDFLLLFLYPLLSYFSYFGIFLLGYLVIALAVVAVRDRKWSFRLTVALFLLSAGYVLFEYRLFGQMLFSDVVTIRSTMVESSLSAAEILRMVRDVFVDAVFHAQPSHTRMVLPVCLLFLLFLCLYYLRKKQPGRIVKDSFVLCFLFIVGNCAVYGIYYWGGFRELVERLIPPLKGFQFSRTIFFNPFLWYALLFLLCRFLYDRGRKLWRVAANVLAAAALAVVLFTPAVYNDFYYTCYYHAYRMVKHTEVDNLNYKEFYSEALFDRILEEIGYRGEYSAAYGMHPSVLSYNGISTLDGYLGFYPQSYKDDFTVLIGPALNRVDEWKTYYGEWGARAYLYSGSGENTWNPVKNMSVSDSRLYIDGSQFARMGGRYLFSRMEISNAAELGFNCIGVYAGEDSLYTIYVYKCNS